jgi:hypothetical protein
LEESRPHNETVRRVIDLVDDLGDTLVEELTRNDRKTLVIDREQFREFSDELQATIETSQPLRRWPNEPPHPSQCCDACGRCECDLRAYPITTTTS